MTSPKPDDLGVWPEREQYRTAPKAQRALPLCRRCGSRHLDPLPWCSTADPQEEPHVRAD